MSFAWGDAAGAAQAGIRQRQQDAASLEAQLAEAEYRRQTILGQQQQQEIQRQRMGMDQREFDAKQNAATSEQQALQAAAEAVKSGAPRSQIVGTLIPTGKFNARDVLDDPQADLQREIEKARQIGDINKANQLEEMAARGAQDRQTIGARGAEDRRTIAARPATGAAGAGAKGGAAAAPATEAYAAERVARTRQSVKELKGQIGYTTAGIGHALAAIPGTSARNLDAQLNTLKANIAFNELQQMRQASKTGGALGQISDREEVLLSSVLGALDPGQSPDVLKGQLDKIDESLARWQQAVAASGGAATPAGGGSETWVRDANGKLVRQH